MTPLTDAHDALTAVSDQMADAVEQIGPAIVQVNGRPRRPASGVVYASTLVLAADHAIEREDDLIVETTTGAALPAQLVGRDPASDLAVLRVPGLGSEPARRAAGPARVGQFVLAVGRPGGRELMASVGIVSAIGGPARTRGGLLEQYIRTDATPYPGFSGGALIDARGGVLGILTTGLVGGAALAVPAALAWGLADSLARQGFVPRGWLGIGSQPVRIRQAERVGGARARPPDRGARPREPGGARRPSPGRHPGRGGRPGGRRWREPPGAPERRARGPVHRGPGAPRRHASRARRDRRAAAGSGTMTRSSRPARDSARSSASPREPSSASGPASCASAARPAGARAWRGVRRPS